MLRVDVARSKDELILFIKFTAEEQRETMNDCPLLIFVGCNVSFFLLPNDETMRGKATYYYDLCSQVFLNLIRTYTLPIDYLIFFPLIFPLKYFGDL
ncbi:MAG TPA: hypothetical protein VK152_13100 [Paludibacter sp.]|nr:hypothetical protein [Paludibacter sp.]